MPTTPSPSDGAGFEDFVTDYHGDLQKGLRLSGEDHGYFSRQRMVWLADCLRRLRESPRFLMDFGCGTGDSTPHFRQLIGAKQVLGVDASRSLLDQARRAHGSVSTRFIPAGEFRPAEDLDLVYSNGVFHHILPVMRPKTLESLYRSLRPRGILSFWENNPWNPATLLVMNRIPFDRDAVTVNPVEARRMLRMSGFRILRTDFLFLFPRFLRGLRRIEPALSRFPFGAQYQVLCRKP